MRQFVLPSSWPGEGPLRLEGGEARYLLRVLRLAPGDSFPGLDAEGRRHACRVAESGEGWLLLEVAPLLSGSPGPATLSDTRGSRGRERGRDAAVSGACAPPSGPAARKPLPRIVLVQSIAKGPAMDLVVRQAAEAGVTRLIPLSARRSVARAGSGPESGRRERWERVLREGLQQSGSMVPTRLDDPVELRDLAARLGPEPEGGRLCLVLHEAPLAQTGLHGYLGTAPAEVVLCIGPEGGLAPDELDILSGAGFRPLLLPGAILRTETAALFAVAAVEIILSERSSWTPSL